jgi:hypothetical protein
MSVSPKYRFVAAAFVAASLIFHAPLAEARPLNPTDPITRIVKYVKKLFGVVANDDSTGPVPPHP